MTDTGRVNTGSEHYRTVSTVNTGNEHDHAVRFSGRGRRKEFLKGLGITVSEEVVREVIECCSGVSDLSVVHEKQNPPTSGQTNDL